MERALVIFESMFGNTRMIAEAVAEGLASRFVTDLIEVSLAPARIPDDVSLVVVGGPTHAFGLTRPRTRADAATQRSRPFLPSRLSRSVPVSHRVHPPLAAAGSRTVTAGGEFHPAPETGFRRV